MDERSLFWSILLDILSLQVYFGRVSIERIVLRVYILVDSILSLERERDLPRLFIFEPTSSLCESILVLSKTGHRQAGSQAGRQAGRYTLTLVLMFISRVCSLSREIERLASLVYFSSLHPRFGSLF